jgi:hypothetical protein
MHGGQKREPRAIRGCGEIAPDFPQAAVIFDFEHAYASWLGQQVFHRSAKRLGGVLSF